MASDPPLAGGKRRRAGGARTDAESCIAALVKDVSEAVRRNAAARYCTAYNGVYHTLRCVPQPLWYPTRVMFYLAFHTVARDITRVKLNTTTPYGTPPRSYVFECSIEKRREFLYASSNTVRSVVISRHRVERMRQKLRFLCHTRMRERGGGGTPIPSQFVSCRI